MRTSPIGLKVTVVIDHPIGTQVRNGSEYLDSLKIKYPINCGHVERSLSNLMDLSTNLDRIKAYIVGVNKPMKEYTGIVVGIIHRLNGNEDIWVVAPEGFDASVEIIQSEIMFIEKYFNSVIRTK